MTKNISPDLTDKKYHNPFAILLAAMANLTLEHRKAAFNFTPKVLVKSGITSRASKPKKPGRGHPAKGYDQENHKWID
jgi:hypothetical protein